MGNLDDALAARGFLNAVSVVAESEARLRRLQPEARAAFAALCAQRLMDAHLRLPSAEQRSFTLSWAPVLREIWAGLAANDRTPAKATVQEYLNTLYDDRLIREFGQNGPSGADDDAAACSIYAAQAFCRGDAESARWAASRLIDATDMMESAASGGRSRSTLEDLAHPLMQEEARRLSVALDLLESEPWTPAMLTKVRDSFNQDTT